MYITAQRVQRQQDAREGINVYVYTHRLAPAAGIDWDAPDVERIADHAPGHLQCVVRSVLGEDNLVLSFLDVAVADDVEHAEIAGRLDQAMTQFPGGAGPVVWHAARMGLRFYAGPQAHEVPANELRRLKDELMPILAGGIATASPMPPPIPAPMPLRAFVLHDDVGYRYEIEEQSRRRLQDLLPDVTIPAFLGVPYEVHEALGGHLFVEYAQVLTHLPLEKINALSGLVFIEQESGRPLWDSRGDAGRR